MKFQLLKGGWVTGSGGDAKFHHCKETVESDKDLDRLYPGKFKRLEEPVKDVLPPVEPQLPVTVPAAPQVVSEASVPKPAPKPKLPVVMPGEDLEKMSVEELKAMAADEEINLKGAASKEAIIKTLRAAKSKH